MSIGLYRSTIFIYMVGGLAVAMCLEPLVSKKAVTGLSNSIMLGIAGVNVLLLAWNAWLYVRASQEHSEPGWMFTLRRYLQPIAATVSWVVGFSLFMIPQLAR